MSDNHIWLGEGSNNVSTMATASHQVSDGSASVEVALSRPAYRLGGTVVGTVRLSPTNQVDPRAWFTSAYIHVAGQCKVDGRWHNPAIYKRIYGHYHPYLKEHHENNADDKMMAEDTVCFWSTNVVNLLDLEERTVGRWKDTSPRALVEKSGLLRECEDTAYQDSSPSEISEPPLESEHLLFTFRVDLPVDIPPTTVATCVRYSYSVVVSVTTVSIEKPLIVSAPFLVWTPLKGYTMSQHDLALTPRVRLGTCTAMAHSAGLPCHVTATDIYRPRGATTVNRNVNLLATAKQGNVQTLRIADPHGDPCCILTALGVQVMYPGSHLVLQFDFPPDWIPCHQVSACLQGEEVALYEDGSTRRTRSVLMDTAHEVVEAGYTERIALNMHVPLDCPYTLLTDLVRITITCRIDIAVEQRGGGGEYTNLKLILPCVVAHSPTADEPSMEQEFDDDDVLETPIDELVFGNQALSIVEKDPRKPGSFQTKDIRRDLKVLSLRMIDSCGLET